MQLGLTIHNDAQVFLDHLTCIRTIWWGHGSSVSLSKIAHRDADMARAHRWAKSQIGPHLPELVVVPKAPETGDVRAAKASVQPSPLPDDVTVTTLGVSVTS